MKQYELKVGRGTRLAVGVLIISIYIFGLFLLTVTNHSYAILFVLVIPLFISNILLGTAKMIIKFSNDKIEIDWKKRFLLDKEIIEPINIQDIRILVVDNFKYLRKIITENRIIEINNGKPVEKDFELFVENLIELVETNNGRVINSTQYFVDYYKYFYVAVTLAMSIILISTLWRIIDYYSLILLLIPLLVYIRKMTKE